MSFPLADDRPDRHDAALQLFLRNFGIDASAPPRSLLHSVVRSFARLPYENLTKILELDGGQSGAPRGPAELISDHIFHRTGGTCFSLTATLRHLLRALGLEAEPLLADRPYGSDSHCALAVWLEGAPHLVDPGYLLNEPVPLLSTAEQRIETPFHEIRLVPRPGAKQLELHTVNRGHDSFRILLRTEPADWDHFVRVWQSSFGWDMMRYPVVTQVIGGEHVYLQGERLQKRRRDGVQRGEIDRADLAARIASIFGIDPRVTARALAVLRRRGERDGVA